MSNQKIINSMKKLVKEKGGVKVGTPFQKQNIHFYR